ncbi:transposase, partial [Alteromonas sp. BZK5]
MKTPSDNTLKDAQIAALSDEIAQLKHQLDWLKRQLFGRKSEKVLVDNPAQSSLFDEGEPHALPAETKPVKAHTRSSQKQRRDSDVNDEGLRFDETVPQQIIDIPAP